MGRLRVAVVKQGERLEQEVDLVLFTGVPLEEIRARQAITFVEAARQFARGHHCYLVPGLYIQDGYLCSCLIDPHGEVVGAQKATHLHQTHFSDLQRDDHLLFFETPWGPSSLFLAVDVDIYKPEVLRIVARSGVKIVIAHQYIEASRYNDAMILAGAWQQAQQNCLYVLHTSNGGSHLIAPCQATDDLSGFIAKGRADEALYGEYTLSKLQEAYQSFPIFDSLNPPLYEKHRVQLCE